MKLKKCGVIMTLGDYIRRMSNEEIAQFLIRVVMENQYGVEKIHASEESMNKWQSDMLDFINTDIPL